MLLTSIANTKGKLRASPAETPRVRYSTARNLDPLWLLVCNDLLEAVLMFVAPFASLAVAVAAVARLRRKEEETEVEMQVVATGAANTERAADEKMEEEEGSAVPRAKVLPEEEEDEADPK